MNYLLGSVIALGGLGVLLYANNRLRVARWRKQAATFLKANERALAERPVWLFSSGPTSGEDAGSFLEGKSLPDALQPIADRIRPRGITSFHGVLNADKLNFIEKWMMKNMKAPFGDFRKWDAITAWATAIADALKENA